MLTEDKSHIFARVLSEMLFFYTTRFTLFSSQLQAHAVTMVVYTVKHLYRDNYFFTEAASCA